MNAPHPMAAPIGDAVLVSEQGVRVEPAHSFESDATDAVPNDYQPFQLDGWIVRPASNTICRDGEVRELTPMAIRVLGLLAATPGEVVSRDELIRVVWAGNYLTGANRLNDEIWRLRAALDDDPKQPRLIKTVPRRGYVLLARPTPWSDSAPVTPNSPPSGVVYGNVRLLRSLGTACAGRAEWFAAWDTEIDTEINVLRVTEVQSDDPVLEVVRRLQRAQTDVLATPLRTQRDPERGHLLVVFAGCPQAALSERLARCRDRLELWQLLDGVTRAMHRLGQLGIAADRIGHARPSEHVLSLQLHDLELAALPESAWESSALLQAQARLDDWLAGTGTARVLGAAGAGRLRARIRAAASFGAIETVLRDVIDPDRPRARGLAAVLAAAVVLLVVAMGWLYREKSSALDRLSLSGYQADLAQQSASSFVLELLSGVSLSDAADRRGVARAVVERAKLILPAYSGSVALQVRILIALSQLAFEFGDRDEARQLAVDARQRAMKLDDARLRVDATLHLARMQRMNGLPREAEALYREAGMALEEAPAQPQDELLQATALDGMGVAVAMQGRLEEAERLIGTALERRRTLLGLNHEQTARAMMNLGITLSYLDHRREEGAALLESGSAIMREALGQDSPTVGLALGSVGAALVVGGRRDEGIRYMTDGLGIIERGLGPGSYEASLVRLNLAEALFSQRDVEGVRRHLRIAEQSSALSRQENAEQLAHLRQVQGLLYWLEGDPAAALGRLDSALQLVASVYGEDGPEVGRIRQQRCALLAEYPQVAGGAVEVDACR